MMFFFSVFILFAGLEGGAYLILVIKKVSTKDYNQLYTQQGRFNKENSPRKMISEAREIHPYFGHTLRLGNNYGFLDNYDFPYKKKENQKVIGIFGGSTAMHWAEWMKSTGFFSERYPNIVLLNLAVSGMKQPQQFHVASHFMDTIDIALFYDGWNETLPLACPDEPDLPQHYRILTSPSISKEAQNLVIIGKTLQAYSSLVSSSWLKESHFLQLIWQTLNFIATEKTLDADMNARNERDKFFEVCKDPNIKENYKIWLKFLNLSHSLANIYKIPLIHLMQVAPYLEGAKPMGEEEKIITKYDILLQPGWMGDRYRQFYQVYKKSSPDFSIDWTFIFKDQENILFKDSYTHLNDEGHLFASQELEKLLIEKGLLQPN